MRDLDEMDRSVKSNQSLQKSEINHKRYEFYLAVSRKLYVEVYCVMRYMMSSRRLVSSTIGVKQSSRGSRYRHDPSLTACSGLQRR